jgi:hypothetical protein
VVEAGLEASNMEACLEAGGGIASELGEELDVPAATYFAACARRASTSWSWKDMVRVEQRARRLRRRSGEIGSKLGGGRKDEGRLQIDGGGVENGGGVGVLERGFGVGGLETSLS